MQSQLEFIRKTLFFVFLGGQVFLATGQTYYGAERFVRADHIFIDRQTGELKLSGHVLLRQETTGDRMTAETIRFFQDKSTQKLLRLQADKNVEAFSQGTRFQANHVYYSRKTGDVILEGSVRITSTEYALMGEKIKYNLNQEKGWVRALPGKRLIFLFIQRDPKVSFQSRLVLARSQEIRLNKLRRKIILQGNAQMKEWTNFSQFSAQRIEIQLNQTNQLDTLYAVGNFQLTQPKRQASSNEARFYYEKGTIVLKGNAKLKETKNALKIQSETIEMFMDEEKGIIEGKKNSPVKIEHQQ